MKDAIILFTRVPITGKTKTRLMPYFKDYEAKRIHTILLKSIYKNMKETKKDVFIYINPFNKVNLMEDMLGKNQYKEQIGKTLNQKMQNAIFDVLDLGYDRVILIGSDIIGMDKKYINNAFNILDEKDIVIGPTEDGGYSLIGMKDKIKSPFDEEKSSHRKVLDNLIERIEKENLSYFLLEALYDIDDSNDFNRFVLNKGKDIDYFERKITEEYGI